MTTQEGAVSTDPWVWLPAISALVAIFLLLQAAEFSIVGVWSIEEFDKRKDTIVIVRLFTRYWAFLPFSDLFPKPVLPGAYWIRGYYRGHDYERILIRLGSDGTYASLDRRLSDGDRDHVWHAVEKMLLRRNIKALGDYTLITSHSYPEEE
jgi:hypothetical protein